MADDDGDGYSNGVELGDPCCVWSADETAPNGRATDSQLQQYADARASSQQHPVSNPGNPHSFAVEQCIPNVCCNAAYRAASRAMHCCNRHAAVAVADANAKAAPRSAMLLHHQSRRGADEKEGEPGGDDGSGAGGDLLGDDDRDGGGGAGETTGASTTQPTTMRAPADATTTTSAAQDQAEKGDDDPEQGQAQDQGDGSGDGNSDGDLLLDGDAGSNDRYVFNTVQFTLTDVSLEDLSDQEQEELKVAGTTAAVEHTDLDANDVEDTFLESGSTVVRVVFNAQTSSDDVIAAQDDINSAVADGTFKVDVHGTQTAKVLPGTVAFTSISADDDPEETATSRAPTTTEASAAAVTTTVATTTTEATTTTAELGDGDDDTGEDDGCIAFFCIGKADASSEACAGSDPIRKYKSMCHAFCANEVGARLCTTTSTTTSTSATQTRNLTWAFDNAGA